MIDDNTKEFARTFLKQFGVTCFFNKNNSWADCKRSWVGLETNVSYNEFISLMFHELMHILAYRTNKFYKYHHNLASNEYVRRNGLRIERWIDKKAKEMMHDFFPELEFVEAYQSEESLKYYRNWLDEHYPKGA